MKLAINVISATAGGGRTYLLNLVRTLPCFPGHRFLLYVPSAGRLNLAEPALPGVEVATAPRAECGYASRFFWEQFTLPREVRRWGADVLICAGNFCPLRSAVPVVLLSRNALYFTPRFLQDLLERGHYIWAVRHVLMTRLAILSARSARLTVTPTGAMAGLLRAAAGGVPLRTIPFGFQPWASANGRPPHAPASPPFRFLVVSHYNYFRNFETVFHAMARLRAWGEPVELILSTDIRPGLRLGGYDTTPASRLISKLGLSDAVATVGAVPYNDLPSLYSSAHAVICPSYAESFGQTLLEAMAMGIPVIASDLPAHREVAGDAVLFFPPFDADALAGLCRSLMSGASLRERLAAAGRSRAQDFSWRRHFDELLAAAAEVARS